MASARLGGTVVSVALVDVQPAAWVVLAGATAGYAVGVRRLARRADRAERWPARRSWAFAGAMAALLAGTTSPLAANAATDPTQGSVAHVLILMLAPLLLAWAAPHTLAIASGSRTTARRVRAVMASRPLRLLAAPWVAWPVYAATLAVLYGSSLHLSAARHAYIGQPVELVLLIVGCAFLWPVFGVDPLPRRLGPFPAMAYLIGLLPYFTLLGMAVESRGAGSTLATSGPVAAAAAVGSDVQGAGGILWTVGGLGSIALTLLVLARWLRVEERATPGRHAGLDPATHAQLVAWRAQRAEAAAEEAQRRAEVAARVASGRRRA